MAGGSPGGERDGATLDILSEHGEAIFTSLGRVIVNTGERYSARVRARACAAVATFRISDTRSVAVLNKKDTQSHKACLDGQ